MPPDPRSQRKRKKLPGWLIIAVLGVIIFAIAYALGARAARAGGFGVQFGLLTLLSLLPMLFVALVLHIIIHELGHLIAGLLTGYRFLSLNLFGLLWVKQASQIRFRRLSTSGVGGQCLMSPPEMVNGKFPYIAYNLGGPLANLAAALIFALLAWLVDADAIVRLGLGVLAFMGLVAALLNGIPLRENVANDGSNLVCLSRDPQARRSLWIQLKATELQADGLRLKQLPDDWFVVSSPKELTNPLTAAVGVYAAARLMDEMRLVEADELMAELLDSATGLVPLHRGLLGVDRVYCELVGKNRLEVLAELQTAEVRNIEKTMKRFPSILRLRYTSALLTDQDDAAAAKALAAFERSARSYPWPIQLEGERELMAHAAATAASRRQHQNGTNQEDRGHDLDQRAEHIAGDAAQDAHQVTRPPD